MFDQAEAEGPKGRRAAEENLRRILMVLRSPARKRCLLHHLVRIHLIGSLEPEYLPPQNPTPPPYKYMRMHSIG